MIPNPDYAIKAARERKSAIREYEDITGNLPNKLLIFDIETDNFPCKITEANRKAVLGAIDVKLIVAKYINKVYNSNEYYIYPSPTIKDIRKFKKLCDRATIITGYNIRDFDYKVLELHYPQDFYSVEYDTKTVDLLSEVDYFFGGRSLAKLAEANLDIERKGNLKKTMTQDELIEYCKQDVKITEMLYQKYLNGTLHANGLSILDIVSSDNEHNDVPPFICPSCNHKFTREESPIPECINGTMCPKCFETIELSPGDMRCYNPFK